MIVTNERKILFTLAAIQFTHIVDFMIVMPLGPTLMRLFSINPQQFGFIVASYTFAAGLFGFLGAFVIDRFDRRHALMFCFLGFTLGTFACSMAQGYISLMAARMFTGAFGGIIGSLLLSIIGDLIPYERRAAAMGKVMMAFSIASVAGVPFGLFLSNIFSWHAPFIFLGCIAIIIFILIIKNIPSITSHIHQETFRDSISKVIEILKDGNHQKALLVMFLLVTGQFTVIPFISAYMVANVGFLESDIAYIYLLGGGASMISMPLIGKLSDRFGKIRIFTIFIFLSLIPIYGITNLNAASLWVALLVTTLFFVVMGGRSIPATTMISAAVVPDKRGSFMSLNTAVQQLSAGVASFVSGQILVKATGGEIMNYDLVGWIAIISSLVCLFTARTLKVRS